MSFANDLEITKGDKRSRPQPTSTSEESCEALWERVLRMCDQLLPTRTQEVV